MDEVERDFLRHIWFPVVRVEDLRSGVVGANILGTELVVYSSGGRTTVAHGRCPHRGMALWLGRLRDGNLECPYHGWLFAPQNGRCLDVPALDPEERVRHNSLTTYPVATAYGHVWTCLGEPYLPLPHLRGYDERSWEAASGEPREVSCGLRQITENFRDLGHLPFVHARTMGANAQRRVPRYRVRRDGTDIEWERTAGYPDGDRSMAKTLTYWVSLPMSTYLRTELGSGGRRILAQFATPVSADGERIRLFWFAGVDEAFRHRHGVDLAEVVAYEQRIFDEDVAIVQNLWPREAPLDPREQRHTRADRFSIAYRAAYREILEKFAADLGR